MGSMNPPLFSASWLLPILSGNENGLLLPSFALVGGCEVLKDPDLILSLTTTVYPKDKE